MYFFFERKKRKEKKKNKQRKQGYSYKKCTNEKGIEKGKGDIYIKNILKIQKKEKKIFE